MKNRELYGEQINELVDKKKRLLVELDTYEYESAEYVECEKQISEIERQLDTINNNNKRINSYEECGTRKNPYKAGDIICLGKDAQMIINSIVRGYDAYRVLVHKEPYIDKPKDMEYVYIQAKITNVGDSRLILNGASFSVVKENGIESEEFVCFGEGFKPMHAGAIQEADIFFKVNKTEQNPILYYEDYKDGIWIDVSTHISDELKKEIEHLNENNNQNAPGYKDENIDECNKGMEAYNSGDVAKARDILKNAALSGNFQAYECLGDIHMNSKKYDSAIKCYVKAIEGGVETSKEKLKNAKTVKDMMDMLKGFESFGGNTTSENVNNIENNKLEKNEIKQKEEIESNPKVKYDLEANKKESALKIALYTTGVIISIIIAVFGYKNANLWVLLGFSIVAVIIGKFGIEACASRCPKCEKLSAMVTISSSVIGRENISKVKEVKDYDRDGRRIGSHQQWVSGVRTYTHDVDECKYCKYRRAVKRKNDSV